MSQVRGMWLLVTMAACAAAGAACLSVEGTPPFRLVPLSQSLIGDSGDRLLSPVMSKEDALSLMGKWDAIMQGVTSKEIEEALFKAVLDARNASADSTDEDILDALLDNTITAEFRSTIYITMIDPATGLMHAFYGRPSWSCALPTQCESATWFRILGRIVAQDDGDFDASVTGSEPNGGIGLWTFRQSNVTGGWRMRSYKRSTDPADLNGEVRQSEALGVYEKNDDEGLLLADMLEGLQVSGLLPFKPDGKSEPGALELPVATLDSLLALRQPAAAAASSGGGR